MDRPAESPVPATLGRTYPLSLKTTRSRTLLLPHISAPPPPLPETISPGILRGQEKDTNLLLFCSAPPSPPHRSRLSDTSLSMTLKALPVRHVSQSETRPGAPRLTLPYRSRRKSAADIFERSPCKQGTCRPRPFLIRPDMPLPSPLHLHPGRPVFQTPACMIRPPLRPYFCRTYGEHIHPFIDA